MELVIVIFRGGIEDGVSKGDVEESLVWREVNELAKGGVFKRRRLGVCLGC